MGRDLVAKLGELAAPSVDGDELVPGRRIDAAGEFGRTLSTVFVGSATSKARKKRITNAIARLTAGPAAMTTIRFHTGWW